MAEFARWQWDDNGFWRDFGETQQVDVEAAFQQKLESTEILVVPFGNFHLDLVAMTQAAKSGRGAGFQRRIRRQAKIIEAGYFLLGEEGEIRSSDSPVDQIEELMVLEQLVEVLSKIIAEPEDFDRRSVQLSSSEFRDGLGRCPQAQDFLKARGFEKIDEGPDARFLVFMHEEVEPLRAALTEAEAAQRRILKRPASKAQRNDNDASPSSRDAAVAPPSNAVSNEVNNDPVPSNALPAPSDTADAVFSNVISNDVNSASEWPTLQPNPSNKRRSSGKGKGKGKDKDKRRVSRETGAAPAGETAVIVAAESGSPQPCMGETRPNAGSSVLRVTLQLSPDQQCDVQLEGAGELSDLLDKVKAAKPGLRLPLLSVKGKQESERPIGMAAEPGCSLTETACLQIGDKVLVQDFEKAFVEKLQSGLLSLQELASVAPLLDWEKPELPKLLLTRIKLLLDGGSPCESWCRSAGVDAKRELSYSRPLVCLLYGQKTLEERLEVCRRLLPTDVRGKAVLKVDRASLMDSSMAALSKLSPEELRGQLIIDFEGEKGEDHGGPRRDFFASFGTRLESDLPGLWRRLGKGAIAPRPDLFAENSPSRSRSGMDVEEAFRACGRAFGLATKHGDVMGEEVAGFFIHQVSKDSTVDLEVLQRELAACEGEDVRTGDIIRTKSLEESGLKGITLSRTISGTKKEVELVPGGKDIEITEENKEQWLRLHLHHKLYGCLQKSTDAFREGILDVLGGTRRTCPWLVLLFPDELASLWAGLPVGTDGVHRWREVATVSDEVMQQAAWFWEVLLESEEDLRAKTLKFTTGAPRFGRAGLQTFEIQPADGSDEMLPHAMTCANMLQLPRYTSKAVLETQLRKATELCDGFQIL